MGRPLLPSNEKKSEQIGVRFSTEEILDFDMVTFDQGFESRTEMARFHLGAMCAAYFDENGGREAVADRYKTAKIQELQAQLDALQQD